MSVECSSPAVD